MNNRALRYLWARHRIAVLSDYNRLRENDARTREVTELGLSYNLLTETTSFVAVDTRRRIENGEWVTVKQPLPLPQGVSDHAVGKAGVSGLASMRKLAVPMPSLPPGEVKELLQQDREAASSVRTETEKNEETVELVVEKIEALSLSEKAVRRFLEKNIDGVTRCYAEASTPLPPRFSILFTIDPTGTVTEIETITPRNMNVLADCLSRAMKGLRFPITGGAVDHGIVVTFAVVEVR